MIIFEKWLAAVGTKIEFSGVPLEKPNKYSSVDYKSQRMMMMRVKISSIVYETYNIVNKKIGLNISKRLFP